MNILTSGGKTTAIEGKDVLKEMVKHSEHVQIKVAGKVTQDNLLELQNYTSATAFHGKKVV